MTTILNIRSRRGFIKSRIQFLSGLMITGATLLACVGSVQAGTITGNIDTSSQFSPTNTSTDGHLPTVRPVRPDAPSHSRATT